MGCQGYVGFLRRDSPKVPWPTLILVVELERVLQTSPVVRCDPLRRGPKVDGLLEDLPDLQTPVRHFLWFFLLLLLGGCWLRELLFELKLVMLTPPIPLVPLNILLAGMAATANIAIPTLAAMSMVL